MEKILGILSGVLFFCNGAFAAPTQSPEMPNGWNGWNDPANFDPNYEYHLSGLPKKGSLPAANIPWSETYWPENQGSINIRWNAPGTPGFDYHSPSRAELATMSREQLMQLSPAEKYDLAMGHYDYPLTSTVAASSDPGAAYWKGICDGWTAAALQFKEPKPVDVKNPDGLVIPFGSSDVKGLMAYYSIIEFRYQPVDVGTFCRRLLRNCDGMNAGAYHVILANEIGKKGKGFGANISTNKEIWNQPVYGFDFQITGSALSRNKSADAYQVHSKMFYTDELDHSTWAPVVGTPQWKGDLLENDYVLELDDSQNITGGYWMSGKRPSVFWKPTKEIVFSGDFAGLNQIYQASITQF